MARLVHASLKMPDIFPFSEAVMKASNDAFDKLCLERDVISFPVADSYAHYVVVSRKPLVLQHVDYMDGYHVHGALIRGLRVADVDEMVRREKALHELFAKKGV
jgi:hypothetical protein